MRLWRISGWALLHTLEGHTSWVRNLAFSPDGALLASEAGTILAAETYADNTIRLWRVSDGTPLLTLKTPGLGASSVAFAPGGTVLAAGIENEVWLWGVR